VFLLATSIPKALAKTLMGLTEGRQAHYSVSCLLLITMTSCLSKVSKRFPRSTERKTGDRERKSLA
jgi:hypothetical protein